MSRSGYADVKSRTVIKQIKALGANIDLLQADVTVQSDVEKAFQQATVPIAGIIQGAMVLRVSHPHPTSNERPSETNILPRTDRSIL